MLADYVQQMQTTGRQLRVFNLPTTVGRLKEGLPIRIGSQAGQGIVLRGDTFVELGNPEVGSCAFFLRTDNPALIKDGMITLIGPDIQESFGQSLAFGQVVIMGGVELSNKEHEALQQLQYVGDQIEGYMVRNLSRNLWSRVGKDAVRKGFSFQILGRALMALYKVSNPKIEAMEIIFVTSGKDDVGGLDRIAVQVQKIDKEIVKENWKIRGYDLDCALDCSSCSEQEVCDEIREVLHLKKSRERRGFGEKVAGGGTG